MRASFIKETGGDLHYSIVPRVREEVAKVKELYTYYLCSG